MRGNHRSHVAVCRRRIHGVTVVGLNLGSPLYLDTVAPERLRFTAEARSSTVAMGTAGIVSNTAAGWLVDHGGTDAS